MVSHGTSGALDSETQMRLNYDSEAHDVGDLKSPVLTSLFTVP